MEIQRVTPEGAYFPTAYTIDVLNAKSSVQKLPEVNRNKIGFWGHSMGGNITLRAMVVSDDIKAGVIWAGAVGSYQEMFEKWWSNSEWFPSQREQRSNRPNRSSLIEQRGTFNENKEFWDSIAPINFVSDISGPVQIHHGLSDKVVPYQLSESLNDALVKNGKIVESYQYRGGDHNLSGTAFTPAMQRSIDFFDKYVKND